MITISRMLKRLPQPTLIVQGDDVRFDELIASDSIA